jgi:hypothetical protein
MTVAAVSNTLDIVRRIVKKVATATTVDSSICFDMRLSPRFPNINLISLSFFYFFQKNKLLCAIQYWPIRRWRKRVEIGHSLHNRPVTSDRECTLQEGTA